MQVNEIYNLLKLQVDGLNIGYKSNIEYTLEGNSEIISLSLSRKKTTHIYKIRTLISYDHIENCNRISTPYFFINHLNVTEILFPILLKNERISYLSTQDDFFIITPSLLDGKQKKDVVAMFNFSIKDTVDINKFVKEINHFVEKYAEPFFAKWSNLEMILELIDNTSQLEFCEMVSHGSYVKAIVYKLMNRELDYREYIDGMVERAYARAIENSSDISKFQIYSCLFELRETLDKI